MAEKTFSIDLEELLHNRARKMALERGVPVKILYAEALTALLDGSLPYPYAEENRVLHDKLERVLGSGDQLAIAAVVPNINLFDDRLRPQKRVSRKLAGK